jgi:hypothetical protein
MTKAERLRAQAHRSMRLARQTPDQVIAEVLRGLAAESCEQANALEGLARRRRFRLMFCKALFLFGAL